ncbi:DegV family protein [Neobacillus notoginsengisoli]|uniref:DegV family protein n=1 Tax=Neobacillus notoginsengisoli TaxID=1578198 RepID=A0A417YXU7_9BACI|nr:DegV family protein [Neobacillus notoginsengisoli]RHW42278.1 DegV family protein [Neobacillus notoginsengisoli]
MKKIAWVTDSTAYLDEELRNHPDLYTIPISVILDDVEYADGIDLTAEELYAKLKVLKTPPKTSQPSVGAFQQLFEKLAKNYDEIITVLLSSKLSGTVSSSQQAAQLVSIPVTTIDSKILAFPLSALLKKGIALEKEGKNVEEITRELEKLRDENETYVLIGSLEQLHRSGRMSGVQFFLGSMLSITPIISIVNGGLETKEKVRNTKKAKEKIEGYMRAAYEKHGFKEVYLLYGFHEDAALDWQKELEPKFPGLTFRRCPLGATIGVHAGENTLGISWYHHID